jgi:soluble lytic murein transglycosylase-like protein
MSKACLVALVLRVAQLYNLPPYLMVAIAEVESAWDPVAVHINNDGSTDRGLMQLNSSWYSSPFWYVPEENVVAAAKHIVFLRSQGLTWYQVAIAYNCGLNRLNNPPSSSINYAVSVFGIWEHSDTGFYQYIGR